MPSPVRYVQLRKVLADLGFRERQRPDGVEFQHRSSDTQFLFRRYEDDDQLQFAEISFVRKQLDERGLLEPESFEALLTRTPTG